MAEGVSKVTSPAGDEPGWKDDPWSGKIEDGQVWGRGSADMKGGVTAMLFAYKYLSRRHIGSHHRTMSAEFFHGILQ